LAMARRSSHPSTHARFEAAARTAVFCGGAGAARKNDSAVRQKVRISSGIWVRLSQGCTRGLLPNELLKHLSADPDGLIGVSEATSRRRSGGSVLDDGGVRHCFRVVDARISVSGSANAQRPALKDRGALAEFRSRGYSMGPSGRLAAEQWKPNSIFWRGGITVDRPPSGALAHADVRGTDLRALQ